MEKTLLIRRSTLIMPADRGDFVEKAGRRGADAICLDLEDGVAPAGKEKARNALSGEVELLVGCGSDILVRVNSDPAVQREDLEAAVLPGVSGIILTKVESPELLLQAEESIGRLEQARGMEPGTVDTTLLIESARGYADIREILRAAKRARTLMLGTEDFIRDLGIPDNSGKGLEGARLHLNIMARAYGIEPRGLLSSITDYSDREAIYQAARQSYLFGYRGATCIHPNQVEPYNRAFRPSAEEIARAQKILDRFTEAQSENRGTVGVDGVMIDIPVANRARATLAFAEALAAKEEAAKLYQTHS